MKASTRILLPVIIAAAVAWVPAATVQGVPGAGDAKPNAEAAAKVPDLSASAIGAVIEANDGKLPGSGVELTAALKKLGRVVQLSFPFSAVALDSGVVNPRVVLTLRVTPSVEVIPFTPPGGWGGGSGTGKAQIVSTPIPAKPAAERNLEGRLFLAANMEAGLPADRVRVKTIEFISWNTRRLGFDFGVIENLHASPQVKLLDGTRCFSCHKNRGPIMGVGPWSNSIHNDIVHTATVKMLNAVDNSTGTFDGMTLFQSDGPDVETAIRAGADLPRNRQLIRALAKTPVGRKALLTMLVELVDPDPLDKIEKRLHAELNRANLVPFIEDSVAIQKATPSNFLADYSPAGSMGKVTGNRIKWGGTLSDIANYERERSSGHPGLPTQHLPSNPKAFLPAPLNQSPQPGEHMNVVRFARTLGLTEGDRAFLLATVREGAAWAGTQGVEVAPAALTRQVFTGPAFADLFNGTAVPDRDDFKDRFIAGMLAALKESPGPWWSFANRDLYASAPVVRHGKEQKEVETVPTTACLRCHDVRGTGKPAAFSPIPVLAFDPFDATGREAWAKATDRKQKRIILARLLRRLGTDKDMPPEDSTEAALFRAKDPASFEAVREWLEAELKKAKGN